MKKGVFLSLTCIIISVMLLHGSQSLQAAGLQQVKALAVDKKTEKTSTAADSHIPEHLSSDQVDSFMATLTDEQAREILARKLKNEAREPDAAAVQSKTGREGRLMNFFIESSQAVSSSFRRLGNIYRKMSGNATEWSGLLYTLSGGKGWIGLLLTLLGVVLVIGAGALAEWLLHRVTGNVREAIPMFERLSPQPCLPAELVLSVVLRCE